MIQTAKNNSSFVINPRNIRMGSLNTYGVIVSIAVNLIHNLLNSVTLVWDKYNLWLVS